METESNVVADNVDAVVRCRVLLRQTLKNTQAKGWRFGYALLAGRFDTMACNEPELGARNVA